MPDFLFGSGYAILAILIGIAMVFIPSYIGGALRYGNSWNSPTGTEFLLGLITGLSIFFFFFVIGIITSTYGQMLLATLDTAVNTSLYLNKDQKEEAIGILKSIAAYLDSTDDDEAIDHDVILCPYCKNKMKDGTRFCTGCGEKMP